MEAVKGRHLNWYLETHKVKLGQLISHNYTKTKHRDRRTCAMQPCAKRLGYNDREVVSPDLTIWRAQLNVTRLYCFTSLAMLLKIRTSFETQLLR